MVCSGLIHQTSETLNGRGQKQRFFDRFRISRRKKTLNGAAHRIAGIAIPLTLVLIAYGIYQTNSAWPLAYLMAVIGGAGAGYDAATEEDTDWKTSEESKVAPRESAVFAATLFTAAGNANVAIWRERSDRWIRFKRPDTRNRCHFAAVAATAN